MNKEPKKAIMTPTRLLDKYGKDNIAGIIFKGQKNLYIKFLRKSKKDFHKNLNVKRITDNRKFWQTINPPFTDKTLHYTLSRLFYLF